MAQYVEAHPSRSRNTRTSALKQTGNIIMGKAAIAWLLAEILGVVRDESEAIAASAIARDEIGIGLDQQGVTDTVFVLVKRCLPVNGPLCRSNSKCSCPP